MRWCQRGVSLIIVLVMLAVIGLLSAAALRSATSNEMVARNFRYQLLAQQQAETALRFCESQLLLPDADRLASLQEASLPLAEPHGSSALPVWALPASWNGLGEAGASLTTVPADLLGPASMLPQVSPQCLVEKRAWPGADAYRLTARGYSANYSRDSQGYTSAGMVSWLQAELLIRPDGPVQATRLVTDRLWSRIVTPPF